MQTCRFKVRDRSSEWKCCFCCHVRTGTIFFGIWHLMLHVLALSVLAVVLKHPELMITSGSGTLPGPPHTPLIVPPTPLSEIPVQRGGEVQVFLGQLPEKPISVQNQPSGRARTLYYQDINTCVIFTFCTFLITLMMVYGSIKGRPVYILPFFCLQVFDFCVSSLTTVGFILYMPDVHGVIAHSPRIPYQRELLALNDQCLSLLVLLTLILALLTKAYFIGVVWSCYKYLMLRVFPNQRTIHYIDTESLLPSYDAAIKTHPAPPPSYATATRNHPPPPAADPANVSVTATQPQPQPQPQPI